MKQLTIYLFGILLFAACSSEKKSKADDDEDEPKKAAKHASKDDLATASSYDSESDADDVIQFVKVAFQSPDSSMVTLSAEVPTKSGTPLADSILAYLDQGIGNDFLRYYRQSTPQKAFRRAAENRLKTMEREIDDLEADLRTDWTDSLAFPSHLLDWQSEQEFIKEVENERFVTYVDRGYEYEGGAHGYTWLVGTTFDRQTGHRVGPEILKNTNSKAFQKLLEEKLLEFFQPGEGESLSDYLLLTDEQQGLPVPGFRLTNKEFIFQYQLYEITYYAAGMPVVIIPIEQMKPFLTQEGLRLAGLQ